MTRQIQTVWASEWINPSLVKRCCYSSVWITYTDSQIIHLSR